jgi:hypothetical protein
MAKYDDPIRLRVLKGLSAALGEISIAAGYKHDMADRVFRGRLMFGESDPIPMISILEVPIPPEQIRSPTDAPVAAGRWELTVQGWSNEDRENPTDPAHLLLADMRKRLALAKKQVTDGAAFGITEITNLDIGPGVVRPPDETSSHAYCWLLLTITLSEDLANPYD